MTCSAGAGFFLKLSRLFVKIQGGLSTLVRMSQSCELSGLTGRLLACSKLKTAKEPSHGPNSVRQCRRKFLFLLLILVAAGSIWFFSRFHGGTSKVKNKTPDSCKGNAQILLQEFNISRNHLHALASLFSKSDKVLCL